MRFALSVAVLFVVLLACLGGCEKSSTPRGEEGTHKRVAASECNLLLITLDTTRADRLGSYGYGRASTPALDGLARAGVRFGQAFASAPLTLPSHATLLTGTYPPENGVRVNRGQALGAGLPTLAEICRQHGYQTGAFVAAPVLSAHFGLDRGFDTYNENTGGVPFGLSRQYRPADEVSTAALNWLASVQSRPFMCWVHFFDPHMPHRPPLEFVSKAEHPYDAEIAFMDHHIGRLFDWLVANDLASKTLVVAVGDHGESLGEHGYKEHALLLYDGILRVPMIFALPGRIPKNVTYDGIVRIADVMPTILDLMGWETPPEVSGESLLAVLTGREIRPRSAYAETDFPFAAYGWSSLQSLITDQWKYIRAPRCELYDRINDPKELINLADANPKRVAEMEARLRELEQAMRRRDSVAIKVDSAMSETLRSLGYVGGGSSLPSSASNLKDPKDMVEVEAKFRRAAGLLNRSRAEEALELLEVVAVQSPDSFYVAELLGDAFLRTGKLRRAQRCLEKAIAMNPDSAKTHVILAAVLAARGRLERAVDLCRTALGIDPDYKAAQSSLRRFSEARTRQKREIERARLALAQAPRSVEQRLLLADSMVRAGDDRAALVTLKAGRALDSDDPSLAAHIARLLATSSDSAVRDGREAVRLALMACEATGDRNVEYMAVLSAAHAEAGRFEDAVRIARRAEQLAGQNGERYLAATLRERIELFESRRAYHELP